MLKKIIRETAWLFAVIVLSNMFVDWADKDTSNRFLEQPLKMLGIALVLSLIGGAVMVWIKNKSEKASTH